MPRRSQGGRGWAGISLNRLEHYCQGWINIIYWRPRLTRFLGPVYFPKQVKGIVWRNSHRMEVVFLIFLIRKPLDACYNFNLYNGENISFLTILSTAYTHTNLWVRPYIVLSRLLKRTALFDLSYEPALQRVHSVLVAERPWIVSCLLSVFWSSRVTFILACLRKTRLIVRKNFQPRHYFKRCSRIEFHKLLVLYHAGFIIVVWHFRGIQRVECVLIYTYLFLLLLLWLLASKSTKYVGEQKDRKFQPRRVPRFVSYWLRAWKPVGYDILRWKVEWGYLSTVQKGPFLSSTAKRKFKTNRQKVSRSLRFLCISSSHRPQTPQEWLSH